MVCARFLIKCVMPKCESDPVVVGDTGQSDPGDNRSQGVSLQAHTWNKGAPHPSTIKREHPHSVCQCQRGIAARGQHGQHAHTHTHARSVEPVAGSQPYLDSDAARIFAFWSSHCLFALSSKR